MVHHLDVALHNLGKEVPLSRNEHGYPTAILFLAQIGEVHARGVEETDACHGDVVLNVARRATGKVGDIRLVPGAVLLLEVFGEPGITVFAITGPDVSLLIESRSHHLEGWEGHFLVFVNEKPPELHP